MKYKLSVRAEIDLIEIWEYTFENWSAEKANLYIEILFSSINTICRNPKIGKNYDYIRYEYLGLKVKSHIIFYKVLKDESIGIIRILHEKMDLPFKF